MELQVADHSIVRSSNVLLKQIIITIAISEAVVQELNDLHRR